MEKLSDSEKKEIMSILRGASREALRQMKIQETLRASLEKPDMERFNFFSAAVEQALNETEAEFMNEGSEDDDGCDCKDCPFHDKCGTSEEINLELNAMLVLLANEVAKDEGKTLSQWLTALMTEKLFY